MEVNRMEANRMEANRRRALILEGLDLADAARARHFVRHEVAAGADDTLTADLELATSELVSNAIEHGAAGVTVIVHDDGTGVAVTVENECADPDIVGDVDSWTIAGPFAPGGRGLGIVRAVSDHVDLSHDGSRVSITARFDKRHGRASRSARIRHPAS
jgi:anti-sigma regulatory factor (Ser/Thr protein kinase)